VPFCGDAVPVQDGSKYAGVYEFFQSKWMCVCTENELSRDGHHDSGCFGSKCVGIVSDEGGFGEQLLVSDLTLGDGHEFGVFETGEDEVVAEDVLLDVLDLFDFFIENDLDGIRFAVSLKLFAVLEGLGDYFDDLGDVVCVGDDEAQEHDGEKKIHVELNNEKTLQ